MRTVMLFLASAFGGGSLIAGISVLQQGDRTGWGYIGIAVIAFALAAAVGWRMRTELIKSRINE